MIPQDLRFDDRACKELLLRAEEYRSKLWFDVEERKACAERTLLGIKEDGNISYLRGLALELKEHTARTVMSIRNIFGVEHFPIEIC